MWAQSQIGFNQRRRKPVSGAREETFCWLSYFEIRTIGTSRRGHAGRMFGFRETQLGKVPGHFSVHSILVSCLARRIESLSGWELVRVCRA
jgi:hypothetical protein